MVDITQLIANSGKTNADFNFGKINDAYYKGRDEEAKNDLRDAFKNGVPLTPDGQPDFGAMAKTLFQKGGLDQGVAATNLDLQRQGIQQNREGANFVATGQAQPALVSPPSINRTATAVVAPPLNKGGATPQGGQGAQVTPAAFLQQVGIQPGYNTEVGLAAFKRFGIEPDQTFDPNDPNITAKLGPVVQRLKGIGQVQPPQPGDNPPITQAPPAGPQVAQAPQPGSTAPMVPTPVTSQRIQPQPPQAAPQAAPSPFQNAVAAGLIPPGVDPNRYVAGLKYRAAALPKGPAQELIQSQVNAIDKASELTASQRDFNASAANPKIDERAAQQKADEAHATGVAQSDIKEQDSIISAGTAARQRLATLNTISNIINTDKNMTLGFGAETSLKVKKALENIGVDVGDLSGPQAIQKLNGLLASESAKSVSARPAQFEFKTFLTNNPGLDLDKAGNQRVIGIFSQLAKRDVDLGKLARQNRDDWQNWDNVVEKYDQQNPIKDPFTGKPITTNSIVAPGPTKAAAPTLEPGKTIVNGHIYKGGNPNLKSNWELRT
jgi:hypothetical protein